MKPFVSMVDFCHGFERVLYATANGAVVHADVVDVEFNVMLGKGSLLAEHC
jgi:hypothetical protein